MPPQTSIPSNQPNALDPQAVNLAKAIRQTESGGNPTAKGKSGEYGAYQYTPATWATDSANAGVNVPLEKSTLEQQNEVAYKKIKALKDKGLNVGQIASTWNAGAGEPDAYTGKFSNGQPSVGTNKFGAKYDVPAYAKSVATAYQTLKGGGKVGADPQNPSSTANQAPIQPEQKSLARKAQDVLTTIFPGTQQIGESLGTAAFDAGQLLQGKNPFKNNDGSVNKASQVDIPKTIGGYLQAGSMVGAPGAGAETALGRISTTAGLGAIAGAGGSLASGSKDVGEITKQGLIGGAVGGVLGGAGELISKATQYLPQRLARTYLPGTSAETAKYAVDKGLGSPTKMLTESDSSLSKIGSGIESVLNHESLKGITATAQDIYPSIIEKYPNAGLTLENVGEQLKKLAPLQQGLVDKLEKTGLTAAELNQLKSAIGGATYKSVFDEPAVKAGKQIGNSAYASFSDWLKKVAPDAAPLFEEYTKELQLNGALQKAIRNGEKARPITLRDIVALMAGLGVGGPLGGLGTVVAEKALVNPSVNLTAGGLINKLNAPAVGALGRTGLVSGIGNLTQAK